jgi:hypothetical protein
VTYCGFISCVVLCVYWCYGVVRLGCCGILMQAEALVLQPAQGYHMTLDIKGMNDIRLISRPIHAPNHELEDTDTNTLPLQ